MVFYRMLPELCRRDIGIRTSIRRISHPGRLTQVAIGLNTLIKITKNNNIYQLHVWKNVTGFKLWYIIFMFFFIKAIYITFSYFFSIIQSKISKFSKNHKSLIKTNWKSMIFLCSNSFLLIFSTKSHVKKQTKNHIKMKKPCQPIAVTQKWKNIIWFTKKSHKSI